MRKQLRIQAAASAAVSLLLLSMYFFSLPGGYSYPGLEILRGSQTLPTDQLAGYVRGIQIVLALDGLFLAAQFLAWTGIAGVLRPRSLLISRLVLILGLTGAVLDLAENSIVWASVESLHSGLLPGAGWLIAWKTIQHLSYLFPLIAAFLAGANQWGPRPSERLLCLAGTIITALALAGLYLPELSFMPDLWYLIWFSSAALLLWDMANLAKE